MKSSYVVNVLSGVLILSCAGLFGCEKSTDSAGFEQKNDQQEKLLPEHRVSEKRTFLKTPPPEQERDRWEEEFLDSAPKDFDPNELKKLQEQILQGPGNIQELEEEFKRSQEEYHRNN